MSVIVRVVLEENGRVVGRDATVIGPERDGGRLSSLTVPVVFRGLFGSREVLVRVEFDYTPSSGVVEDGASQPDPADGAPPLRGSAQGGPQ